MSVTTAFKVRPKFLAALVASLVVPVALYEAWEHFDLGMALLDFAFLSTPLWVLAAWWLWWRTRKSDTSQISNPGALFALASISTNAFVFYGWLVYRLAVGDIPFVWRLKDDLSYIGITSAFAGLVTSLLCQGSVRVVVAIGSILGLMIWVSIGIL